MAEAAPEAIATFAFEGIAQASSLQRWSLQHGARQMLRNRVVDLKLSTGKLPVSWTTASPF